MTRREQIIDAGIEFTLSINPVCLSGGALWEQARMLNRNAAFEAGAKFADEHPYWHKYPDKKPKHKGRYLIIAQEDKDIYIADFIPNNNVWFGIVLDPIAWMELPKFNG